MRKLGSSYTYFDCLIHRNTEPGSKLRWWAFTAYRQVAADTLDGIRELIREDSLTTAEKARRAAKNAKLPT